MLSFVRYFLIIALFGIVFSLKATHNRAGEITYKWISGYTYSITLVTYTDDGPSVADRCKLTLFFGDGDSAQVIRQNGSLDVSSSECPTSYRGVLISTSPNIKENIYSCVHTYSGPGNYKMYMFDHNRNSGVMNIPNSVNQPFYVESFLVIGALPNSSSIATVKPIDQASLMKCFFHNRGSYDIDGDSLSYQITTCRGQDPITGNLGVPIPGYTYPDPGTSGIYNIDSITGTLTWCAPQMNGEYNIAFITKEWRKSSCSGAYSLVGYVLRDMQVLVSSCANNPPVITAIVDTCIAAGTNFIKTFKAADDPGNTMTITATGAPFNLASPVATFPTVVGMPTAAGSFAWQTSCAHIRVSPYQVTIKAKDDGFPVQLVNFKTYNITVIAPSPQNLTVTPGLNIMKLGWNKPSCHPASGNKIDHYNIYRKTGSSSWAHSVCERGVPASSGLAYLGFTSTENDTTMTDYTVTSFTNGTTCSYVVVAVYKDCSESYASNTASDQLAIGIDEKTKNNYSINIFPNPSSEIVNIELNTQKPGYFFITLFDINGR